MSNPWSLQELLEGLQWFDREYGGDITPREYHSLQSIMCSVATLKQIEEISCPQPS